MLFTEKERLSRGGDEACPQMQNPTKVEGSAGALVTWKHFADVEEEHPANRIWAAIRRRPRCIFSCSKGPVGWKAQGCRFQFRTRRDFSR